MRRTLVAGAMALAMFLAFASISSNRVIAADSTRSTNVSARPDANDAAPPLPLRKPSLSLDLLRDRLDYNDQLIAMRALHLALSQVPDGGTFVWRKRSRNLKGLIKPTDAFRNASGQVCRNVTYALSLGRYLKQIKGVACRQHDGSWRL